MNRRPLSPSEQCVLVLADHGRVRRRGDRWESALGIPVSRATRRLLKRGLVLAANGRLYVTVAGRAWLDKRPGR